MIINEFNTEKDLFNFEPIANLLNESDKYTASLSLNVNIGLYLFL